MRAVINTAAAVTEQMSYDAYGRPSVAGMATQKSYIGERRDAETGLL